MLLEEFDPAEGVITPFHSDMKLTVAQLPEILITPFSGKLMAEIVQSDYCRWGGEHYCINQTHPIYIYQDGKRQYTVARAELGAPACVSLLEELYAKGVKKVIIFDSCGVLDGELAAIKLLCQKRLCGMREPAITMRQLLKKSRWIKSSLIY